MHWEILSEPQRLLLPFVRSLRKEFYLLKLFRQQLCYFDDVDYTEEVTFMSGQEVKDFLTNIATLAL